MSYGWQARLVNIDSHEICEVWNDEFARWIYLDASHVNFYSYDKETLLPQNFLDLHEKHLDFFYPGNQQIDWQHGRIRQNHEPEEIPVVCGSLTHHEDSPYAGMNRASFMRIVPRNNYYEKPYPMPLAHGMDKWPWQGYINWYDEKTPPQRKQKWFTDRPRDMWPDLNTVHILATSTFTNDRLFLQFETYTPNFCHYEVNTNNTGWKEAGEKWTWFLVSGKNTLQVRAASKAGVKGKSSTIVVRYVDEPLGKHVYSTLGRDDLQ
jgi:hypothetical protein